MTDISDWEFVPGRDDMPTWRRVSVLSYTRNQPDNLGAWRIGEACRRAADEPKCGDYIDRGLILLRELEARGFGVVPLGGEQQ